MIGFLATLGTAGNIQEMAGPNEHCPARDCSASEFERYLQQTPIRSESSNGEQLLDWHEVMICQQALAPFYDRYAQITDRKFPPLISPWESYAFHVEVLQKELNSYWRVYRLDDPPSLENEVKDPSYKISHTEDKITHPSVLRWRRPEGSCGWDELHHRDRIWNEIHEQLKEAKESVVPNPNPYPAYRSESHDIQDILDSIIARDPVRYAWWLTRLGYVYYIRTEKFMTWDDWCTWFAPTTYEGWYKLRGSTTMPWEGEPNYLLRLSGPRPAITLQQAKNGYLAWATSCNHRTNEPHPGLLMVPDRK